jgi:hypothetical protein
MKREKKTWLSKTAWFTKRDEFLGYDFVSAFVGLIKGGF